MTKVYRSAVYMARDFALFCYALVIAFLIGKWLGYFPYSYWIVFSPVWVPFAFGFVSGLTKGLGLKGNVDGN